MNPENSPFILKENSIFEFDTLLDDTCARLQHKKAQFSIRRIQELDEILISLEKELDLLISLNYS